ncbi:cupin [Candidatus Nomurabacteria bacterium RIFCSPHIGHO2_02_FULL_37_45]|uniref:Cupin n=1 Tax=Candidatus Nomurabacteria bacterium RIFCSPHIGHO2_12_FULL_37_29 TaxID=1801759 RepID=A0A1F6WBM4_9BACT|nr:MAG: cupin [Candidatus Nomurabacteria bacterium RIFCSPHIGHO2_01_FULL_37_110]OGI71251.1 MAG: cupin [Candidatus Nomurabacteria bacterium RIFCSPHIGHO2_02_FULL_37_45]OGI73726.1 MAG: cupin [Candidatus Nomurabacteria bacterium RIFCSPHIGHO2_02_40_30]OGI79308.1 MAG: cupin [Candidatus Nomurabacteria bacterium RIFCSPHIGHO2_12_FULL_37_29]OGI84857.1 MAG: cupin [Candidatus Nomurabacteria bacterium RIFCSPLOWO2_01_FULL_37_49]
MKGFKINIEKATKENTDYRRVLYTAKNSQLVLMNLKPGEEIGEEVHKLDQFIRIEEGEARAIIDGEEHSFGTDEAIMIPQGTRHNIVNTGSLDLKLYTLYSPPEHQDGTIQKTKMDEKEEHFDGVTTQ